MVRTRAKGFTLLAGLLLTALAVPVSAWAQASPEGFAGGLRASRGHYHEGEIGEILLTIERELRCNCSCGLDVHSCQFQMQCDVSPGWTQRILASLEAGESPDAIEAGFVADFGGSVLMSPPARGFNLIGYLLPTVAIITAGMLIGLIARGRVRTETAPARELNDEELDRLRTALRQLDEAEGPDW